MKSFALLFVFLYLCRAEDAKDGGNPDARIIGGTNAARGQFPPAVSLRNGNDEHIGAGCIIAMNWVLTVAHIEPSPVSIVAGSIDRTSVSTRYFISTRIKHPQFNPVTLDNNIAVLKTKTSIAYNSYIARARLPSSGPPIGTPVAIVGWGAINEDGSPLAKLLKYFTANTLSIEECSRIINRQLDFSYLCTFSQKGQGVCKLDDGGPLLYDNYVYGLIMRPTDLCANGFPDLSTRVSKYESWIRTTTGL